MGFYGATVKGHQGYVMFWEFQLLRVWDDSQIKWAVMWYHGFLDEQSFTSRQENIYLFIV